jgi:Rrf2 family protein
MISKTSLHAILALASLSKLAEDEYAGAAHVAREVGAPANYLGKLLKQLASEGLVKSQKGYGGGFRLTRPASKISLYDIVEPIEKVSRWNGCFLGQAKCSSKSPCVLHNRWEKIRNHYLGFLKKSTVAEIAKSM